jgi:chlorite dismutase
VIVVPIRKDAAWWGSSPETRGMLMAEHTKASLPYLKTVKRKLYHASGLSDVDFVTYFETGKLDDFNNLIVALKKVKENAHNERFGDPLFLGTVRSLEEVAMLLAR